MLRSDMGLLKCLWNKYGYVRKVVLSSYYRKHKIHIWAKECLWNTRKLVGGYAWCGFALSINFVVFSLSFIFRIAIFHAREASLSERDVYDMIAA